MWEDKKDSDDIDNAGKQQPYNGHLEKVVNENVLTGHHGEINCESVTENDSFAQSSSCAHSPSEFSTGGGCCYAPPSNTGMPRAK